MKRIGFFSVATFLLTCASLVAFAATGEVAVAQSAPSARQVVLLIDSSVSPSIATQLPVLRQFAEGLSSETSVAVAYNFNGHATFATPFTTDKAKIANAIHLPAGGQATNGSPYFAVSELAEHWPSNLKAQREIILISDGQDPYYQMSLPDPYVSDAIHAARSADVTVNSVYWTARGGRTSADMVNEGQSRLLVMSQATGGDGYWLGIDDPVNLSPFLRTIARKSHL